MSIPPTFTFDKLVPIPFNMIDIMEMFVEAENAIDEYDAFTALEALNKILNVMKQINFIEKKKKSNIMENIRLASKEITVSNFANAHNIVRDTFYSM